MRAETEYNFKNSVVLFTHKKGYFNECIRTSAKKLWLQFMCIEQH